MIPDSHNILKEKMMFKFIKLFIIAISFCIVSCKNNIPNQEIIHVNPEKTDKTQINIEIKSVIKLETKESSLIGEINNIEYFEDKIYILDKIYGKSLMVFRNDGKFINKTKMGKGPGEVISPWGFTIDKMERSVLLWDSYQRSFFKLDMELNYLSRLLCKHLIRDFVKTGNDTYFAMTYKIKDESKQLMTTYAIYADSFKKVLGTFLPVNNEMELEDYIKPISQFDQVLFTAPWDYNIYKIINNEATSIYYWDFGKYAIRKDELKLSYMNKWGKVHSGNRVGPLCDFVESKAFLSVSVNFKNDKIVYFYSKRQKTVFTLNSFIDESHLPRFSIGNIIGEDTFLGIVEAKDYISFKNNTKDYNNVVDNVDENDNPVIILFKIIE